MRLIKFFVLKFDYMLQYNLSSLHFISSIVLLYFFHFLLYFFSCLNFFLHYSSLQILQDLLLLPLLTNNNTVYILNLNSLCLTFAFFNFVDSNLSVIKLDHIYFLVNVIDNSMFNSWC